MGYDCKHLHTNKSRFEITLSAIQQFLTEKSIESSVHPIWVIVIGLLACYITKDSTERFIIVNMAFYSLLFEMLNSSIEQTNDRWGCEYQENTRLAKDFSGSVTMLSRIPLFGFALYVIFRNTQSCYRIQACE